MTKFKWFYLMLCLNFVSSISILFLSEMSIPDKVGIMAIPLVGGIWYGLMFITTGVLVIMGVCHLKLVYKLVAQNDFMQLRRGMRYMKLGTIPFFLINFLYFAVFTVFPLLIPMGTIFLVPEVLIMITAGTMTYIILLCTSVYGIGYLFLLKKTGGISLIQWIVNTVLQVIFVLDIFDTIYLLIKFRKNRRVRA